LLMYPVKAKQPEFEKPALTGSGPLFSGAGVRG